jgi:hypothetical protein
MPAQRPLWAKVHLTQSDFEDIADLVALKNQIMKTATPLLEPGETIQIATVAAVGQISAKRQIATATVTALLTLGTVTTLTYAKKRPIALTNRRCSFSTPTI